MIKKGDLLVCVDASGPMKKDQLASGEIYRATCDQFNGVLDNLVSVETLDGRAVPSPSAGGWYAKRFENKK